MKHDELDIMARTVWGEARGEDEIGKIAVAHVIKNRAKHPKWWGKTIMEVCLKPWQFSCWNKKDPNREKMDAVTTNDPTFKLCLSVCKNVMSGVYPDPTGGATHYHTESIKPDWQHAMTQTCQIGHHVFYVEK